MTAGCAQRRATTSLHHVLAARECHRTPRRALERAQREGTAAGGPGRATQPEARRVGSQGAGRGHEAMEAGRGHCSSCGSEATGGNQRCKAARSSLNAASVQFFTLIFCAI